MSYIVTNLRYADLGGTFVIELPKFFGYLADTIEVRLFLFTFMALVAAFFVEKRRARATTLRSEFLRLTGIGAAVIGVSLCIQSWNGVNRLPYLVLLAVFVVPVYLLLSYRKGFLGSDPLRWFGLLSLIFIASALFSIYKAHRPFPHYLLFLFLPVCTAIAWMLVSWNGPRLAFVCLLTVLTLTFQTYLWGTQDDQVLKTIAYTIRPAEGRFIRYIAGADAEIVVWGWNVRPYLGSGLVPATRDTNIANFFRWPEISAYYRDRFVRDFAKASHGCSSTRQDRGRGS